jgi:ribokinase
MPTLDEVNRVLNQPAELSPASSPLS